MTTTECPRSYKDGTDDAANVCNRWIRSKNLHESLAAEAIQKEIRSLHRPAPSPSVPGETAPAGDSGKPPTATEIVMNSLAATKPERDELKGEQTFLTYNERVGTWDLRFYEAGWSMHDSDFLGATHWLDITAMWPGVIAQAASFCPSGDMEQVTTLIGNEARRYASHYKPSSDGRNTFLMFAEWVEKLATPPAARVS